MASSPAPSPDLVFHPLTPERWQDLERLFGERGACGGCWCMWWRLKRSEFEQHKGAANKESFRRIVESGEVPGILAYREEEPVAWCAIAPRERYPVLDRSRILKRVDDQPAWSVVCFFVAKPFRRRGVMVPLLKAAVRYAAEQGATIIEGYPVDPKGGSVPDVFAYHGLVSAFLKVGFEETARRSEKRPFMRLKIADPGA